MQIEKFANNVVFEYNNKKSNKENPEFDIILALTIGKIIFDIIAALIKIYSKNPEKLYRAFRLQRNAIVRITAQRMINKHYPNRSDSKQIRDAILSQEFSQEDFKDLVKEVQNESA